MKRLLSILLSVVIALSLAYATTYKATNQWLRGDPQIVPAFAVLSGGTLSGTTSSGGVYIVKFGDSEGMIFFNTGINSGSALNSKPLALDSSGFLIFGNDVGATPGGADTNIQFNSGGELGGEATFAYDDSNGMMTVSEITATAEIDAQTLTIRRFSLGQTNNIFEIQDESNNFLGGVDALGNLTMTGSLAGTTGTVDQLIVNNASVNINTGLNTGIAFVSGPLGLGSDGYLGYVPVGFLYIVDATVITNITTEGNRSGGYEYIGSTTGMDEGNRYIDEGNYVYEYDGASAVRTPIGGATLQAYGENYADAVAITVSLPTANTFVGLTGFTEGLLLNTTTDLTVTTGDQLILGVDGTYKACFGLSFEGTTNTTFHIAVFKNGAKLLQISSEERVGASADVSSIANCGLLTGAVNDVLQLYVSATVNTKTITWNHGSFMLNRIGE